MNDSTVQLGLANLPQTEPTTIYQVKIRKLAEELGHVRYMGVASLGALAAIDDRIDIKLIEKTVKTDKKLQRFEKENLAAVQGGAKAVILSKE